MNENIKFNVIIPTLERPDTLFHSLRTVVAQNYKNLRIIVSDNYSQDNTKEVVNSFNDPRIIYFNTGKRLSMSHNWEFALSKVNNGWVGFLGDDDGLLPDSLHKIAELIKSTKTRAIRSSMCSFLWPDVSLYKRWRLSVPINSGFEVRDTKTWLSKTLRGYANYPDLPMIYNGGFVCHSLVEKIKIKNGMFFQSSIPDIYSAIAFSSIIGSYIYSNEPFAINGASHHSRGTIIHSGACKKIRDSLVKQILSENNIPLHPDIQVCADGIGPLSLQAQVYESYLQTRHLRNQTSNSENLQQQQLEVILATSGRHTVSVREWGKEFAAIHGLNFDKILSISCRKKISIKISSIQRNISHTLNICHLESGEFPMNNVYEASLAASIIRKVMSTPIKNISRLPRVVVEFFRRKRIEKKSLPDIS